MLGWSLIEFKEGYENSGEYRRFLTELKWGTDFLIKAHVEKYKMAGLIGDPHKDHENWLRPEDPKSPRTPSHFITDKKVSKFIRLTIFLCLATLMII